MILPEDDARFSTFVISASGACLCLHECRDDALHALGSLARWETSSRGYAMPWRTRLPHEPAASLGAPGTDQAAVSIRSETSDGPMPDAMDSGSDDGSRTI